MRLNLAVEKNIFADQLSQEIVTGGLTVVDAIERLFAEWLEDSILQSLGDCIIKAPRAVVHPMYYENRFQNLARLSQGGYVTCIQKYDFLHAKINSSRLPM